MGFLFFLHLHETVFSFNLRCWYTENEMRWMKSERCGYRDRWWSCEQFTKQVRKVSSEKNCCYSSVEWSESIFSSERDFRSGDIIHLGVYRFSTFRTKCFVRRQEYNSKKTSRRKLFMRNRWVRVPQRISRIWPLIGQKHRLVIGPKRICAVKCKWIRVTRQNLTGRMAHCSRIITHLTRLLFAFPLVLWSPLLGDKTPA